MHQLSVVAEPANCLRYSRSCLFEEERRPSKQVSDMLEGPTTTRQNGQRLLWPPGQTFTDVMLGSEHHFASHGPLIVLMGRLPSFQCCSPLSSKARELGTTSHTRACCTPHTFLLLMLAALRPRTGKLVECCCPSPPRGR